MNGRTLAALGWTDELEAAFTTYAEQGFDPARVVAEHRGGYAVRTIRDDRLAHARGKLRDDELWGGMPTVGDWVVVVDAGERYAIEAVLPRRTKVHVLVANVDTLFIVSGLDHDFNIRRLERYLATAWESGANPVIVLTKLDVLDDAEKLVQAEAIAMGVPVHAVSNVTAEGLDALDAYLDWGKTIALIGSSGVGKSTLVNSLAGRELMPIGDLRNDGRGRHTTRHRQLHALRNGALLVDTPGLRELQIWEGDIDRAFADIGELVTQCRFNDCSHGSEPGCAISAALADGTLDAERWTSYRKLERELARLSRRRNHREQAELKRRWRERARETKAAKRRGWKP